MDERATELLHDVLREARSIQSFVQGLTYEDYVADKKTRFAVERCFEIVGEALTRLGKRNPTTLESIRDSRAIRSFRNIFAHAYDHIEDRIVWGIIEGNLPSLIEDVTRLLEADETH